MAVKAKKQLVFTIEVRYDVDKDLNINIEEVLEMARGAAEADILDVKVEVV